MTDQRVACLLFKNGSAAGKLAAVAEACYRFSPQIAVRDEEAIFLEIGGSLGLFKDERTLTLRMLALVQRFGLMPQLGFAEDAPTALAMARFGCNERAKLPLDALFDYVSPFAYDADAFRRTSRLIETLGKLGLKDLAGFAALPPKMLASRFGAEGIALSAHARGEREPAWPRFRLPERIVEAVELHEAGEFGPCIALDPLFFVLRGPVDRAMARLHGRGRRASAIELELGLEYGEPRLWKLELPLPQGTAAALLPILRERLQFDVARAPFGSAVTSIRFEVTQTAPSHGGQRDFFHRKEEEAEAWSALVGRLCQKLGKEGAFLAAPVDRHLPEAAWRRVVFDNSPQQRSGPAGPLAVADCRHPARPVRVLRKPRPLRRDGNWLVERPNKRWHVREWHGPERISCEWWRDPALRGFNRDYYRVVTEGGAQLWVFSDGAQQYLHGYFD